MFWNFTVSKCNFTLHISVIVLFYVQMLKTSMSKHFVRVHKWDAVSAKAWQSITLKRTGLMKVIIYIVL